MKNAMVGGAVGALLILGVLAFTSTTAPSRHFIPTIGGGLSLSYAVTMTGDPGNTGVPTPGVQALPFGAKIPAAAPNDGGTTVPYIEYGRDLFATGTKAISFKNNFAIPPACVCTDDTAIAACDVTAVSTSQATFGGTGTDKFHFICIGDGT